MFLYSRILRQQELPRLPFDVRKVYRPDGVRLSKLFRIVAAAEQQMRQFVRRGLLHGDGRVRQVPAHVHPVCVTHELHGMREGTAAAER